MVDIVHYDTNQYLFYFDLNCMICVYASTKLESDRCSKMPQLDLIQLYSYFQCAQHRFTNNWVTTELKSVGVSVVALYAPHTSVMDWMGLNFCCTKWNWKSSNGDCNFWTYLISCDGASMGSQVKWEGWEKVFELFWKYDQNATHSKSICYFTNRKNATVNMCACVGWN